MASNRFVNNLLSNTGWGKTRQNFRNPHEAMWFEAFEFFRDRPESFERVPELQSKSDAEHHVAGSAGRVCSSNSMLVPETILREALGTFEEQVPDRTVQRQSMPAV